MPVGDLDVEREAMSTVRARNAAEIESSWFSVGAETMDRDYTLYEEWKEYLDPLGITTARLQAGWEKTEQEPGVYDFNWLDDIVFDMDDRGVEPWMCLCYGNGNIDGGGGSRLGASAPSTEHGTQAWLRWVRAIVSRYRDVIDTWEVWNEPNNTWMDWDEDGVEGNAPETYADLFVRTGRVIRDLHPDATIVAMSLAGTDPDWCRTALERIEELDGLDLVDEITYHPYSYNPDGVFEYVADLKEVVREFDDSITVWQGENGCPSEYCEERALDGYEWSETSQAKWALRRLLGDRSREIKSSYFQIIDMLYTDEMNRKGLLYANHDKSVAHRKEAYFAVQSLASVFDDTLEPIADYGVAVETDRGLSAFGFEHRSSGKQALALWFDDENPADETAPTPHDVTVYQGEFDDPVVVDLRTGAVFDVADDEYSQAGTRFEFEDVPLYDSPVLVADRSVVPLEDDE